MLRLLIIARESKTQVGLYASLTRNGKACSITSYNEGIMDDVARQSPDLVMVEIDGHSPDSRTWELIQSIKQERSLPVMALVARERLDDIDGHLDVDDFLTSPCDAKELVLRIKRLLP